MIGWIPNKGGLTLKIAIGILFLAMVPLSLFIHHQFQRLEGGLLDEYGIGQIRHATQVGESLSAQLFAPMSQVQLLQARFSLMADHSSVGWGEEIWGDAFQSFVLENQDFYAGGLMNNRGQIVYQFGFPDAVSAKAVKILEELNLISPSTMRASFPVSLVHCPDGLSPQGSSLIFFSKVASLDQIFGTLFMVYQLNGWEGILGASREPGETFLAVVDHQGRIVLHDGDLPDTGGQFWSPWLGKREHQGVLDRNNGEDAWLVSSRRLNLPGQNTLQWTLLYGTRVDTILTPLVQRQILLVSTGFGVLFLCFLIAWIVSRFVLSPVRKLSQASGEAIAGDWSPLEKLTIRSSDEAGIMAQAFHRLLLDLRESLRNSEQAHTFLRHTLDSMSEGVLVLGETYRVTLINRTGLSMAGMSHPQAAGKNVDHVLQCQLNGRPIALEKFLGNQPGVSVLPTGKDTLILSSRKGWNRYMRISFSRFRHENTPGAGMVLVLNDMTSEFENRKELQEARNKAELANKAKSNFLAVMSHELRTPLNSILGFSSLLLKDSLPGEPRHNFLEIIDASSRHLLRMINDILDTSLIDSGRMDLDVRPVNLKEFFLRDLAEKWKLKGQQHGLRVEFEYGDNCLVSVYLDPDRLHQILGNLIDNAIKFSGKHPVQVTLNCGGVDSRGLHQLVFSVRDQGPGIPEEEIEKIFQPFHQSDMTLTRKHPGVGLGLAICRNLAELMQGRVWAENHPQGGAVFFLDIRVTGVDPEVGQQVDPSPHWEEADNVLSRKKALLVEDDPSNQEMIRTLMQEFCLTTHVVPDVPSARDLLKDHSFDILLVDLMLPGINGRELIQEIKQSRTRFAGKKPWVIAMTADCRPSTRDDSFKAGADDFLSKPFDWKDLANAMNLFLESGSYGPPHQ